MIVIVFVISIMLNLVLFYIEFWPIIKNRINKEGKEGKEGKTVNVNSVKTASIKALLKDDVEMSWNDTKNVYSFISSFYNKQKKKDFYYFHFPRGYLYYGTIKFLRKQKNNEELLLVKKRFDNDIFLSDNSLRNEFKFIDQVVFGLAGLSLYNEFKEEKYLDLSRVLIDLIYKHIDSNGIIKYRLNSSLYLVDTLGMVVEFLFLYSKLINEPMLKDLACAQIEFYVKYGCDERSGFPAHAVSDNDFIKLGSNNWGRGIGWFLLGYKKYCEQSSHDVHFRENLRKHIISKAKGKYKWSQFIGSSDDLDSSTSLMVIYGLLINDLKQLSSEEFLESIRVFLDKDCFVKLTSGDTMWINRYSSSFERSELSQGILMLILAEFNCI